MKGHVYFPALVPGTNSRWFTTITDHLGRWVPKETAKRCFIPDPGTLSYLDLE